MGEAEEEREGEGVYGDAADDDDEDDGADDDEDDGAAAAAAKAVGGFGFGFNNGGASWPLLLPSGARNNDIGFRGDLEVQMQSLTLSLSLSHAVGDVEKDCGGVIDREIQTNKQTKKHTHKSWVTLSLG